MLSFTVTEFIALASGIPEGSTVTSIIAVAVPSEIVKRFVVKLKVAVPVIGPIVPVTEFNSLPDTKTVNTPSICPTADVADTPDGVTNAYLLYLVFLQKFLILFLILQL